MSKKKYDSAKTADLLALELLGVKFVKLNKDGTCTAKKSKKGATHALSGTKLSSLIEPLKRWPKPPKVVTLAKPSEPDTMRPDDQSRHPPIPVGATWLMYATSTQYMLCPIGDLHLFRDYRGGRISFGKLRYNEDFVSMMPGEEGNVTYWKSGTTSFAEGKDPASLKAKEKAAVALAERKAAGLSEPAKAAFAAQVKARSAAAAGPRSDDITGVRQCGVTKPKAGGTVASIWEACDALLASLGHCPTKLEVAAKLPALNAGTVGTQHSAWRRFYGQSLAK